MWSLPIKPIHRIKKLLTGWIGRLNYRITFQTKHSCFYRLFHTQDRFPSSSDDGCSLQSFQITELPQNCSPFRTSINQNSRGPRVQVKLPCISETTQIDIVVPYNSYYNLLTTSDSSDVVPPPSNETLAYLTIETDITVVKLNIRVHQAVSESTPTGTTNPRTTSLMPYVGPGLQPEPDEELSV